MLVKIHRHKILVHEADLSLATKQCHASLWFFPIITLTHHYKLISSKMQLNIKHVWGAGQQAPIEN